MTTNPEVTHIRFPVGQQQCVDQHIGRMIRLHRKACGLTPRDLSLRVGLRARALRRFETGNERIGPKILADICTALDVNPVGLFESIDSETLRSTKQVRSVRSGLS
ncbi:MAG: helix-turn-helix transcriptional regulator [Pseudomonadota bacterium]